jgi:hypothetical protein
MPGTAKTLFAAIVGFVFGAVMLISWIPRLAVSRSPVFTGTVVARTPITEWSVPRVDFAIKIAGSPDVVHAHTQRYLLSKIPNRVRFRYSGDPSRLVYLFEHEENPLWIGLFCWTTSAFLGTVLYHQWSSSRAGAPGVRRALRASLARARAIASTRQQ